MKPRKIMPSEIDRLFSQLFDPADPGHLPINLPKLATPIRDIGTEKLQERIEDLVMERADQDEVAKVLKDINDSLTLRNQELQARLEAEWEAKKQYDRAFNERNQLEHKVHKLEEELEIARKNQNYALQHVADQYSLIEQAKKALSKIENLYSTEKVNAEHLGKQTLRLHNEKQELANENANFREQIIRLAEEKSRFACPGSQIQFHVDDTMLPCGQCNACKLKQVQSTLNQTTINLVEAKEDNKLKLALEKENRTLRGILLGLVDGVEKVLRLPNRFFYPHRLRIGINDAVNRTYNDLDHNNIRIV